METKKGNQRGLAPLMLMPRGAVVWRRLIHFDSRARRWYWLVLPGLSTAIMVISFLECPGRLKCLAAGFSLLFLALPPCSRRHCLRVLLVSPTYCWLHLLQVMTYMIFVDKQLSEWQMVKFSPAVVLVMELLETVCWILCSPCWCLQAVHCLQGEKPVLVASVEGAFREDLTTKSLMLVGRRKATIGGSGMVSLQRLDVWRMRRYLWIVKKQIFRQCFSNNNVHIV